MQLFIYFFIFALGTFLGSFLNCIIYRLEKGESFLKGRSYCPYCRQTLSFEDLIPLLSFLVLRGKCRYCQKKISWQYPLVEIATGLVFLLIFIFQSLILNFIIGFFLILIFIFDLKHYLVPDEIIYPAILITLFWRLVFNFQFLISNAIFSAVLAAASFGAIILFSKGKWMGWGDVLIVFLMGLFLGYPSILVALYSTFFIGAVVGLILIFLGKKGLKSEIPFGPFLVLGTFLALFFSQKLIDFYFRIFLIK